MVRQIIFFVSIIFPLISCDYGIEKTIGLHADKHVVDLFSKEEISQLQNIVHYLDKLVVDNHSIDMPSEYSIYMTSYKSLMDGSSVKNRSVDDLVGLDSLITSLRNNQIFHQIWKVQCKNPKESFDINSCELIYNPAGNYLELLDSLSTSNEFIRSYSESYWNNGNIPPTSVAGFYKSVNYLDYNRDVHRLFCAIHFITVASQARLDAVSRGQLER